MAYLCADRLTAYEGMSVSATASRSSGLLPLGIFFNATATTDASTSLPFHELLYIWDFDDASAGTFTNGRTAGLTKDAATGPVAAHVYHAAGTYNPTVTVFNGLSSKTFTLPTITVSAWPDDANTICVSSDSLPVQGIGGVPDNASVLQEDDFPTIVALGGANKRILLKAGDVFLAPDQVTAPATGPGMIGAYGSANNGRAIVRWATGNTTRFLLLGATSDLRICDTEYDGQDEPIGGFISSGAWTNILLSNLEVYGVASGVVCTTVTSSNTFLSKCDFQNFVLDSGGNGGAVARTDGDNVVYLDCNFDFLAKAQQPIRVADSDAVVIQGTTVKRNPDGSENGPGGGSKGGIELRNAVGAANNVVVSDGLFYTVGYCALVVSNGTAPVCTDVIFERNWLTGEGLNNSELIDNQGTRVTIRNNTINQSPLAGDADQIYRGIQMFSSGGISAVDTWIYNNSFYRSSTYTNNQSIHIDAGCTGTIVRNNLAYGPNLTTAASIVINDSSGNVTASNNSSDAQLKATTPYTDTTPSDPNAGEWNPTGYALTDALATVPVFDDFNGTRRNYGNKAPVMVMGAVQP